MPGVRVDGPAPHLDAAGVGAHDVEGAERVRGQHHRLAAERRVRAGPGVDPVRADRVGAARELQVRRVAVVRRRSRGTRSRCRGGCRRRERGEELAVDVDVDVDRCRAVRVDGPAADRGVADVRPRRSRARRTGSCCTVTVRQPSSRLLPGADVDRVRADRVRALGHRDDRVEAVRAHRSPGTCAATSGRLPFAVERADGAATVDPEVHPDRVVRVRVDGPAPGAHAGRARRSSLRASRTG